MFLVVETLICMIKSYSIQSLGDVASGVKFPGWAFDSLPLFLSPSFRTAFDVQPLASSFQRAGPWAACGGSTKHWAYSKHRMDPWFALTLIFSHFVLLYSEVKLFWYRLALYFLNKCLYLSFFT
jgi:hypothetical protein